MPAALEKAERYRLLNEPIEAESICLDVLELDPDDQRALMLLVLALSDRFDRDGSGDAARRATELVGSIRGEYERHYLSGIICERRAKAQLGHGRVGAGVMAYHLLRDAMTHFETAESIRPPGNDDAILRWNACARLLMRNPHLQPEPAEEAVTELE